MGQISVLPIEYLGFLYIYIYIYIYMRVCTCEGRQSIVACGNDLVGVHDESYEENKVFRCYKLYIQANAAANLW